MPLHTNVPLPPSEEPFSTPMVYVTENPTWEYKVLVRTPDELPETAELDQLGKDGWELASAVPVANQVYFYFKRLGK